VSTRMFSEEQLEALRSFLDIGKDDLIRYFTLAAADLAFVDPGRGRGPVDRLGLAVQLSTLPWLGFVPDEVGLWFRRWQWPAWRSGFRWILRCWRGMGGGSRPVLIICGW
jgi:Domain of unknown function (DUF4158)